MRNEVNPNKFQFALLLVAVFFANTTFATNLVTNPLTKEEQGQLESVFRQFFNPTQFNLAGMSKIEKPGGGLEISGNVSLFGISSVQLNLQVQGDFKIREAVATFPAAAKFKPLQSLSRVTGDINALRSLLPQSFLLSDNLNIQSFTLALGADGKTLDAFTTEFVSADWNFMGLSGLKMKNAHLSLIVRYLGGKKNLEGQIQGSLSLAGQSMEVNAALGGKKEDLLIKGTASRSLKLGQLLESLGGQELRNEFAAMAPGNMTNYIEVPAFSFTANPFVKEFLLQAQNSIGNQELKVRRNGSKSIFSYSYEPNANFSFGALSPDLSWLDQAGIQFQKLKLRVSNDPSTKQRIVGNPPLGLDIESAIIPTGETKKMLGNSGGTAAQLTMRGGIDVSLNTLLALDNEMNLDLGNGWKYERVVMYLENRTGSRGPTLGMKGSIVLPVDNTKLRFTLGMSGQPGAAAMGGDLLLESINDDGNLKEWREPFGIPYITFGNLGGAAAISGSTLIDHIGLKGKLKFGAMPSGTADRRLSGQFDAKIDVDLVDSWIKAKLNHFSLIGAVQAFDDRIKIPNEVADFLGPKCENVVMDINPQNKSFAIGGTAHFFGLGGTFEVKASKSGFAVSGIMTPIDFKLGDLPIFQLKGISNSGPVFSVDLSEKPQININGKATIFGIASASSQFYINDDGLKIFAKGQLFDHGPAATVSVRGSNFDNVGNMVIKIGLDAGKLGDITQRIRNSQSSSLESDFLRNLPMVLLEEVSYTGKVKDLKTESVFKVGFRINMFGNNERFDVKVPLRLDVSSPEAFAQSIAEAIGLELLSNFNFVEKGYEEFTAVMETTVVQIGTELEGFGKEMEKGFGELGNEVRSWFESRSFKSPKSGRALEVVPPGYRHVAVKINYIKVISDDDASGGEDIYGRIFLDVEGSAIIAPGTNSNFFGVSEDKAKEDKEAGDKINVNKTKHIYVKQGQSVTLKLGSEIWEDDVGHDDKFSSGNARITINDYTSTESKKGSWKATHDDSELSIHYTVQPGELVGSNQLLEAIQYKDFELLKARIRKGGNIKALGSEGVRAAARSNDFKTLVLLQKNGMNADNTMLREAAQGNYDPQVVHQLMRMGANPSSTDVEQAINHRAIGLAMEMIEIKGVAPTLGQMQNALNMKEYGLAQAMLKKGLKPTASDLQAYIDKNDNTAINMLLAAGTPVAPANLTASVGVQNWELLDILLSRQKPELATFTKCAELNNTEKFTLLCQQEVPINNFEPARIAIDKNNMEILKLCLGNGSSTYETMNYALQRGHLAAVEQAVTFGADPNQAIDMAMDQNNTNFLTKLLNDYGANGELVLDKAYARNNLSHFSMVFQNASPNPSKYMEDAANNAKWEMVDIMLVNGADPNLAMKGAIGKANVDLLNKLIESGASVDDAEYMRKSTELRSIPMMNALLAAGANPNPGMDNAVKGNHFQAVQLLLENGASPKGFLFLPASNGDENMVRLMLDYGADPNEGIYTAAEKLHVPIVQMLLENGANAKGHMEIPAKKGSLKIVTMLVEYGADPNEGLKASVSGNHYPIANYLINFGASPKDLVYTAANFQNIQMVELLVENGDDPKPGMSPAIIKANFDLLKLLVDKYEVDPTPVSYLFLAVDHTKEGSHVKIAGFLLEHGADPNAYRDPKTDDTLLHIICGIDRKKDRDYAMTELLVKNAADVNTTNKDGWTPLHAAVNKGRKNLEAVVLLVEAGADINACTAKGKSVLRIADGRDVNKFLKEKGAEKSCN